VQVFKVAVSSSANLFALKQQKSAGFLALAMQRNLIAQSSLGISSAVAILVLWFFSLAPLNTTLASSPNFTAARMASQRPLSRSARNLQEPRSQCRKKRACRTRFQLRREGSRGALLLRCLRFDLLNHDGLRTAPFVNLAACGDFVSSKRQKLRVQAA